MTNHEIITRVQHHAIKEAEKDLLFGSLAPLAKLSEDDKRAVCSALKFYAASGATRAIQWMEQNNIRFTS